MPATDDTPRNVRPFPGVAAQPFAALPPLEMSQPALPQNAAPPLGRLSGFVQSHPLPFALGCMVVALAASFAVQSLRQTPTTAISAIPAPQAPVAAVVAQPQPAQPQPAPASQAAPQAVAPVANAPAQSRPQEAVRQGDLRDAVVPPGVQIAVHRVHHEAQTPAALIAGWDALRIGKLDASRSAYEQALREDAKNTDAMRGLAAIAQRQEQAEEARRLYQRILEIDPKDTATAASLGSQAEAGGNPMDEESRLKSLAASDAAVPAVHFALGNLYAGQARWKEAEQAYFEAVSGEPENPDYHYNLAVCLDQLTQPQLAAQYYKSALSRSASRAPAFDLALVRARLVELESQ